MNGTHHDSGFVPGATAPGACACAEFVFGYYWYFTASREGDAGVV